MNNRFYQRILYFISATIILTLAVQAYWNYKNYEKNLKRFQNEVQISLDNALEVYYADLTEKNHITFIDTESNDNDIESVTKMIDKLKMDSIFNNFQKRMGADVDSMTQIIDTDRGERAVTVTADSGRLTNLKVVRGKSASDSIKLIKNVASIYISILDDSLRLSELAPLVDKELARKQIDVPFALDYTGKDSIHLQLNEEMVKDDFFETSTKSKFLKQGESLKMRYPNATIIVLKEGLTGIVISFLLLLGVIACLFYMLNIIKNQRQLSELKNDLISNITHEFKTPISTIGVAIESIRDFEGIDDPKRTTKYLNMSSEQLSKLNTMVEKLLETATLDRDQMELNKEPINLVDLLKGSVEDLRLRATDKVVNFERHQQDIVSVVDPFHFDNAINNILDNALKYGGRIIDVSIARSEKRSIISISDNGTTLSKSNKDKIFEKFYRVPKGNTHDVKGFGIGLYYSKKIIESHGGSIDLIIDPHLTTFKITVPNEH